jgi:hypothetical protein
LRKRGKFNRAFDYGAKYTSDDVGRLFNKEYVELIENVDSIESSTASTALNITDQIYHSYLFSSLIEEEIIETIVRRTNGCIYLSKIDDSDICFYNLLNWMLTFSESAPADKTKKSANLKSTLPAILATFLFRVWRLLMMTTTNNNCSENNRKNSDCECRFCQPDAQPGDREKSSKELWEKFNNLLRQLDKSQEEKDEGKYSQFLVALIFCKR